MEQDIYNKFVTLYKGDEAVEDLSGIRKRLKERREELGYSYQTLANLTGMCKSTLQRYETGAIGNLPLDKLDTLAKALNCSAAYLMGWENREDAKWMPLVDEDVESNAERIQHDFKVLTLQRLLLIRGCTINRSIANVFFVDGIGSGGILQDSEAVKIVDEAANYTEYLISRLFSSNIDSDNVSDK